MLAADSADVKPKGCIRVWRGETGGKGGVANDARREGAQRAAPTTGKLQRELRGDGRWFEQN